MLPSVVASELEQVAADAIRTAFPPTTPGFSGLIDRFLADREQLLKGPYVSVALPFHQGSGRNWFPQIPLPFPPYRHQEKAFERLLPGSPRNTLVATGTGSGKTECFLLPLLEHCRQQQAQGQRGIKAILDLQEVEPRKRDCVLNRCLIDRETNQRISYCAPSDHMAEQRKEPDFPMKILLVSHLITHGYESGLWADDFERFLQQQLELVGAAIAQATGATHEKPAFVH